MLVLVEDSAEALASSNVQPGDLVGVGDRRGQWMERAGVRDALVWTMLFVTVKCASRNSAADHHAEVTTCKRAVSE